MKIRNILVVAIVLAAMAAMSAASAQAPRGGGGRGGGGSPFGNFPLQIAEVEDGLFMIRSSASGNITVFESDDALLLVDSKLVSETDGFMEQLRTVTDKPIKYLVNTHVHPDHAGGNIAVQELGADIIATENARARLAEDQIAGLPNITFDDHMRMYFGGHVMDFYWFGRGHTNGDLIIHLPEEGLVMPGDLFAGGEPSVRLIDYRSGGSLMEWADTLGEVMKLDFDRVIPGHSELTDRAEMQDYLDEIIGMQNLIREMHAAGRAPADIQTAVTTEYGAMGFVLSGGTIQSVLDELE